MITNKMIALLRFSDHVIMTSKTNGTNKKTAIGWYKFSAEHPEGEYLDIPVSSKLMNRIVGGDSDFDDFESYIIIENPKALSAYFFDKNEYFSFPKGYTLLSNNEYESVIVKKGKKKFYFKPTDEKLE